MVEEAERHLNLEQRVKELERQVRGLKTRNTKLANRVEELELLDFQQQISQMNEAFQNLEFHGLRTQQAVSKVSVVGLLSGLIHYLGHLHVSETGMKAREYFLLKSTTVLEQLSASDDPLSLANQFALDMKAYCENHSIEYFTED